MNISLEKQHLSSLAAARAAPLLCCPESSRLISAFVAGNFASEKWVAMACRHVSRCASCSDIQPDLGIWTRQDVFQRVCGLREHRQDTPEQIQGNAMEMAGGAVEGAQGALGSWNVP